MNQHLTLTLHALRGETNSFKWPDDAEVLTYTVGRRGTKSGSPSQVMGSLADKKCVQGQRVSGILVKKNFNYHILTPSDLSSE